MQRVHSSHSLSVGTPVVVETDELDSNINRFLMSAKHRESVAIMRNRSTTSRRDVMVTRCRRYPSNSEQPIKSSANTYYCNGGSLQVHTGEYRERTSLLDLIKDIKRTCTQLYIDIHSDIQLYKIVHSLTISCSIQECQNLTRVVACK